MSARFVRMSDLLPATRVLLGLAFSSILATAALGQAAACDTSRWAGIPTFTGSLTLTANASKTGSDGSSIQVNEQIGTAPDMSAPSTGVPFVWSGPMNSNVNFNVTTTDSLGQTVTIDGTGDALSGLGSPGQMYLSMDPIGCTYTLTWDGFVSAQVTNSSGTTTQMVSFDGTSVVAQPLPASGTSLVGSYSYTDPTFVGSVPLPITIAWNLSPGTPSLDLAVKITGYANWIPTAGATEKDTGLTLRGQKNFLLVQVVLLNPDGSTSLVAPDKVELQLVNGSTEPGVSMNWPKTGATSDPDLTFDVSADAIAALPVPPTGLPVPTLSQNNTVATFSNLPPAPVMFVSVAPHDWGAWATLNVTATVGTQTLTGHLDGNKTMTDILLPKRNDSNSHIATAWLTAMGIAGSQSDSSDTETTPSNSNNGDGLTLYEEYRGFAVKCPSPEAPAGPQCAGGVGHIYGNPNKKDLFVIVDDALRTEVTPGILNFQAKTNLKVHHTALTTEYVNDSNVINFNHGQGAHIVDQHAVLIKLWGLTSGCTQGGPGTPMDVKQINIPHLSTIIAKAQELKFSAAQIAANRTAYQGMSSHELGHAVDISHHGDFDPRLVTWSTSNGIDITENVRSIGFTSTVTVFSEPPTMLLSPADLGITTTHPISLYVGITGGQHSGDTKCLIRYGTSSAYIDNADATIRYWAQEQPGFGLTDTTTGTNTNASGHAPQPRYGDAANGRGDCLTQLCVSDALHVASRGAKQPTCP